MFGLKNNKKENDKKYNIFPRKKDKSTNLYEYLVKKLENGEDNIVLKNNSFPFSTVNLDETFLQGYEKQDAIFMMKRLFDYMREHNMIYYVGFRYTPYSSGDKTYYPLAKVVITKLPNMFLNFYNSEDNSNTYETHLLECSNQPYFDKIDKLCSHNLLLSNYNEILEHMIANGKEIDFDKITKKKQNCFPFIKKRYNIVKIASYLEIEDGFIYDDWDCFITCDFDKLVQKLSNLYNYDLFFANYVIEQNLKNNFSYGYNEKLFNNYYLLEMFPQYAANKNFLFNYCLNNVFIVEKCLKNLDKEEQISFCLDLIKNNPIFYKYIGSNLQKEKTIWKFAMLETFKENTLSLSYVINHSNTDKEQWKNFIETL